MRQYVRNNEEGSITVFLSLVLLMVLSLVMTVIEGARVSTAKVMAERAFTTAMDSALAEFYGPLMVEYHLLALDAGYGSSSISRDELEGKLMDYMSYTFSPDRGLSYANPGIELYGIASEDVNVEDVARITEYGGKLFVHEACGYMKYKAAGDGLALLLEKLNLLEKPKKISYIYEKKLEVEEQLVVIDEGILSLMEQLDGVSTSKKGLDADSKGNIKTVSDFTKKICYGAPDMGRVGINNSMIFEALKSSYIDPSYCFGGINGAFNEIEALSAQINEYYIQQEETRQLIADEEERIVKLEEELALKDEEDIVKETKAEIKACRDNKKELNTRLEELQGSINSLQNQIASCVRNITSLKNDISDLISSLIPVLNDAVPTVNSLIDAAARAKPLISDYEATLSRECKDLDKETCEGLFEDLQELKRYEPDTDNSYDFGSMKEIMEKNLALLSGTQYFLSQGAAALSTGDYYRARGCFNNAGNCLTGYRIGGLELDYSTLVVYKDAAVNPLGMFSTLVQEGLMGLVIDTGKLSEASINKEALPSSTAAAKEAEGSFSFKELFNNMTAGSNSGLGGLFSGYNDMGLSGMLLEGMNAIAEQLLYQEYIAEHFHSMPLLGEDISERKPSVLSYELEYLITGKEKDKDNLSSVISRIILLRTLLDFTSVLGNKERMNETRLLATALVGFTGLYVLVIITQTILLILLAFSEALVDTCAILTGKELPLLKKSFAMSSKDMFMLNREYIQKKADQIGKDSKGLTLGYRDYLRIFLFFKNRWKLSYRCMDLIQENLRLNYDKSFNIHNCLFGFDASADFRIRSKFITISYIQKYIHGKGEANYSVKAGYSY